MKKKPSASVGIDPHDFDKTARPQDDFYRFACGGWLKKNPIPKTETIWGSFYIIRDKTRTQIKEILEGAALKKKNRTETEQLVGDLYRSGMDEARIEKLGLAPLAPEFAMIAAITDVSSLMRAIAHLHTVGSRVLFSVGVSLDEKNSDRMAFYVGQGSLGLPEREYYLEQDEKFASIREKYLKHIAAMLAHAEEKPAAAKAAAGAILDLETALARASMSAEERRDVEKMYNKMTVAQLQKLCPTIEWKTYLSHIGTPSVATVIVGQTAYMQALSQLFTEIPLDTWCAFLRFRLISASAGLLPEKIVRENFNFYGKVIAGLKEIKPRWQRVFGVIDTSLQEAVGTLYTQRHWSTKAEAIINDLVGHLIAVFGERIATRHWMSAATKKKALQKLGTFRAKIGTPKKARSYEGLVITPHDYLQNAFNAARYEFGYELGKLSRPIDRDEWLMGAHVVNAYYWANQNEIVFPAAILQPPFFDEAGDAALNYGAIGAVIGHELTHGFDDKGSLFDHKGNLKNWWKPEDRKAFTKQTKLLVEQYNAFPAVDELMVNGKLTLGENIADLGGIVLAYHALQKHMEKHGRLPDIDGFTPEQRFFLGLVRSERSHMRVEAKRYMAVTDPHAPSYTRTNGPLAHFAPFYESFEVKKGDGMYREPKKRVDIW